MSKLNLRKNLFLLMAAHASTDLGAGAIPALLPFLIQNYNISYAAAAGLAFANSIISCLLQPIFGLFGDRAAKPWFISLGVLLSGVGIALCGLSESYWLMFASLAVTGLGTALFHPEGGKMANYVAGEKKAVSLGIFTSGGSIGFALGPIALSVAVLAFGVKGTAVFFVPAVVLSLLSFTQINKLSNLIKTEKTGPVSASGTGERLHTGEDDWKSFVKVVSILFLRSILSFNFSAFLPIFWIAELGRTAQEGSIMLSIMSFSGIVSMLACGYIADRYGYKRVIIACAAMAAPLYLAFSISRSLPLAITLVVLVSFINTAPQSTLIALAQSHAPRHIGLASGIALGLGTTIGGVCSPLFGLLGDHFGIPVIMYTTAVISLILVILSVFFIKEQSGNSYSIPEKIALTKNQ